MTYSPVEMIYCSASTELTKHSCVGVFKVMLLFIIVNEVCVCTCVCVFSMCANLYFSDSCTFVFICVSAKCRLMHKCVFACA